MAQTRWLRLVLANDPRSYREAIATAIQHLRPDVVVVVVVSASQTPDTGYLPQQNRPCRSPQSSWPIAPLASLR